MIQSGITAAEPAQQAALSSGQNKLPVSTSQDKASFLDSPWLPVIAAGLRLMEAKPGQSFVQNLGGAGGAAINTAQAQRETERKYQQELRKETREDRKVAVTEDELAAKKPYYASQAEYLKYKSLAEKYEKIGTTPEGDVIVRDITKEGPGSLAILDGVKSEKWLTAKAGKEIQAMQNADNREMRLQIHRDQMAEKEAERTRKESADSDRMERGFGAEYRAQQGAILKRRSESGDMSGTIKFDDELEAFRHAQSVYGGTRAAEAKQKDLAMKLEQRVQMAREQAKKTLKGKELEKQLNAIEQYNKMNRLTLGLD